MKALFQNVFFKMGVIVTLILLLLIPAVMVQDLIYERMDRQQEAVFEVSSKHAGPQELVGPILTIPYTVERKKTNDDGIIVSFEERHKLHVLPEHLKIEGEVTPEKRSRGLFEVIVYGSDLDVEGYFGEINLQEKGIDPEKLLLDKAFITLGISDLKGLTNQVHLNLNDEKMECRPGVLANDVVSSGLHVLCPMDTIPNDLKFDFNLSLNGSEDLMFAPIGKVTDVELNSSWKDPSFQGDFLPLDRSVSDDGFKAKWKILHLNRNYPQALDDESREVQASLFGVNLMLPIDVYQKSMRVAKYALLFIALTYLVFFFVEILNRVLIHPIQYILVGLALVLFYVLMLAFGEQMHFDIAYLLAAAMTISLIFLYCRSVLKSWGLAALTGSILTILYGFIFIIIQMQDYALLFGSLGVFLILAVTMYFSRKIEWFELKKDEPQAPTEKIE